jgi:hypothetical protein
VSVDEENERPRGKRAVQCLTEELMVRIVRLRGVLSGGKMLWVSGNTLLLVVIFPPPEDAHSEARPQEESTKTPHCRCETKYHRTNGEETNKKKAVSQCKFCHRSPYFGERFPLSAEFFIGEKVHRCFP